MTVIAMTREMGSRGKDVAAGLAERLGLQVVHQELVERGLADRLDAQESEVHRFLEGSASLFERWKIDRRKLSRYTAEEILQLAARGEVLIRGWGAPYLLRPVPHVLCVRICAPLAVRARTLMARLGSADQAMARREIERSDAAHKAVMQSFFRVGWENPLYYDIVLNSERLPVDACVEQICRLVESPAFEENDRSRGILADRLIESRVISLLEQQFSNAAIGRDLDVTVAAGTVTLTGAVVSQAAIEPVLALVREVEGVAAVKSDLAHLPMSYMA